MHIKSCKEIDSAVDTALKKHKIFTAKRTEERKAAFAAHRELLAKAPQVLPNDQDMDVDSDQVNFNQHLYYIIYISSFTG